MRHNDMVWQHKIYGWSFLVNRVQRWIKNQGKRKRPGWQRRSGNVETAGLPGPSETV